MNYLGLALFAEGSTDHRLLGRLLHRLSLSLCIERGRGLIDVSDLLELRTPAGVREIGRPDRVLAAACQAAGAYSVLFVHADANGDGDRAYSERVRPCVEVVEANLDEVGGVGVVPVRESEAWALCDGEALRGAFGTTLPDEELGLPARAKQVEQLGDPKAILQEAWKRAHKGRKSRRRSSSKVPYEAIAERLSLDRLREIPSFVRLEAELTEKLTRLGYLK